MLLLGVLLTQVWHWISWTHKEKRFVSIILVCHSRIYLSIAMTDQEYWVLVWSLVSSIFVTVWEFNLFVSEYGKFAQFADSTGTSSVHDATHVLTKVFSWLPVIDETVVLACQIFNLERSYRINGNRILVIVIITPFM
jgi:hypothetical protein